MIGTLVGNFRIVSLLGTGGMGEVWLARNENTGTRVAIKLLRHSVSVDTNQVQRLFNEAIAVSRIPHAGIVHISDSGFHAGQAYLVMELLEGETLDARIQRQHHLSIPRLCTFGAQIVSVLVATHAAGVIHRDLKPDNVFIVPDAETGERVKVLDFGLAKLAGNPALTTTAMLGMGTPLYMSPEQWRNAATADGRADVYSLGCVLFEMACGRPPFEATSLAEACARHLSEKPPLASDLIDEIPESLDALLAAMLAKHPADRPDLAEIAAALESIGGGHRFVLAHRISETIESAASTRLIPAGSRLGRNVALALGALTIAGATMYVATRSPAPAVAVSIAVPTPPTPPTPPTRGSAEEQALDAVFVSAKAVRRLAGEPPVIATGVDLQVCIGTTGRVAAVDTPIDIDADTTHAVRDAVLAWRYAPYRAGGVAVPACFPLHLAPPRFVRPARPARRPEPSDAGVDPPPADAAPLPARLDSTWIRAAVAQVRPRLDACAHEPREVKVTLAVSPGGAVSNVMVLATSDERFVACLTTVFESMTFGRSIQGGLLRLTLMLDDEPPPNDPDPGDSNPPPPPPPR